MPVCPTCFETFARLGPHLAKKTPCVVPGGHTLASLTAEILGLRAEVQAMRVALEGLVGNTIMPTVLTVPTVPTVPTGAPTKNAISLFSGAGGDTLGLERGGWKVVGFNEFNEPARLTHLTAFPQSVRLIDPESKKDDIKAVPDSVFAAYKGAVNLVFAGFPCQGFSHAGKKKSDDSRNELVHQFARVARVVQPEWIIGENVKGLLARKGKDPAQPADAPLRPVIEIIRDLFDRNGYKITYRVIDVTTIGVPQHRKRLIIVGHRGSVYPHMPWDDLTMASTPAVGSIRHFLESHLVGAMELPALYKPAAQDAKYWISTTEVAASGAVHPNLDRLVRGIRNRSGKEKAEDTAAGRVNVSNQIIEPAGLISFGVRKGGYHGMILNPDLACNTIISTYNLCPRLFVGLYNATTGKYWIRCMTPKELGQIQGFPAEFAWQGVEKAQIAQIGNAVPPPLAERVVRSLDRVTFHNTPQADVDTDDESDDEDDE